MRYLISLVFLIALIVGWQRSAIAQADVTGIVAQGSDFVLRWPSDGHERACIVIPEGVIGDTPSWKVDNGTVVTIHKLTGSLECEDLPPEFCAHEGTGKRVYRPIMEFSAVPAINLGGTRDDITIAVCGQYLSGTPAPNSSSDRVTRSTGNGLEFWKPVAVPPSCNLRCPGPSAVLQGGATGYLRQLFAGSPFTATPLYAFPFEGGLGGGGGSLSPFAI
ncbi:MAG: hypothetical protein P8Y29_11340, partial [Gemmatimonadota bacterium]